MKRAVLIYPGSVEEAEQLIAAHRAPGVRVAAIVSQEDFPKLPGCDFLRTRPKPFQARADAAAVLAAFPSVVVVTELGTGRRITRAMLRASEEEKKRQPSGGRGARVERWRTPGRCEVLSLLGRFLSSWIEYRGARVGRFLGEHGIRHDYAAWEGPREMGAMVEETGARVVLNEVWQMTPQAVADLAARFPGVRWVNLNHGSPCNLPMKDHRRHLHAEFVQLSLERPNVFYGTVMAAERWPGIERLVSLPNLVMLPEGLKSRRREIGERVCVSMVGRMTLEKNWPGHMAAACVLAREVPLTVAVCTRESPDEMRGYLRLIEMAGADWFHIPWGDWEGYLTQISNAAHLCFQASLMESFNSVAAEHMLLGIPVVGSQAIEYLPRGWQANPQDPVDLCRVALDHLDLYETRAKTAGEIARRLSRNNAAAFLAGIEGLLN